ncbi:MAG: hypothetical protein K0S20_292 [Patescibacteria group bacterium]|jgi:hypothetical protein|nr:hypothetical protein [Patescibacteria group bacterium]
MAELVQLDRAAAMVGKSEVTLRRLIKAGKIPFQKEKTLTGFVYLVDPDKVKSFYKIREGVIVEEGAAMEGNASTTEPAGEPVPLRTPSPVRVAVAGESGSPYEYWQKKSELYEERYNQEVVKHSQAREELGVWRGRAEQSQAMLLKLLPSPQEVEVRQTGVQPALQSPSKPVKETSNTLWWTVVTILGFLLIAAVGGALYLRYVIYA